MSRFETVFAGRLDARAVRPEVRVALIRASQAFALTSLPFVLALFFSGDLFDRYLATHRMDDIHTSDLNHQDGVFYQSIIKKGYSYHATAVSNVGFFPAYPLLCSILARLTGVDSNLVTVLVSNVCLLASFFLLYRYLAGTGRAEDGRVARRTLLLLGSFPTSFFFHVGYTESMFLLLLIGCMTQLEVRGNVLAAACWAGIASGTRSTGVVLVVVLVAQVAWDGRSTVLAKVEKVAVAVPLALTGLASYMAYLGWRFGVPLGFVDAQNWFKARLTPPLPQKVWSLLTLEPYRCLYSWDYYETKQRLEQLPHTALSLQYADGLILLVALIVTIVAARAGWLRRGEILLSVLLMAFSYGLIGYESYLRSQGRYMATNFLIYYGLARLLDRADDRIVAAACGLMMALQFIYCSLFLEGYLIV